MIDSHGGECGGRGEQPPCGELIQIEHPPGQHGCRDGEQEAEVSEAEMELFKVSGACLAGLLALAVLVGRRLRAGRRHMGIIACG